MSNYVQTTFFTPKDTLPTTSPAKTIFGAAYDVEFGNIAAAILSKYDNTTVAPSLLSLTVGTPAGGNLGAGSINAQSIFVNNVAVLAGSAVTSLTGTANQIVTSASTGAVVLTLAANVIIPTPVSGINLIVPGIAGTAASTIGLLNIGDVVGFGTGSNIFTQSTNPLSIGTTGAAVLALLTNNSTRVSISSVGAISVNPPTTGSLNSLTITGANGGGFAASFAGSSTSGNSNGLSINAGTNASDIAFQIFNQAFGAQFLKMFGDGHGLIGPSGALGISWTTAGNVTTAAPNSGIGITINGFNGTHSIKISDSATNLFNAGFLEIPQNSKSAAYTTVLSDSGKHIYHPSADTTARTWTIDSNANVPYPIGTAITFDNDTSAGVITLAITTDTLVWLPSGTTGSRSIAANGQGTILKVAATRWHLTGIGIT